MTQLKECFEGSSPLNMQGFLPYIFRPLSEVKFLMFLTRFKNLSVNDMVFYTTIASGRLGMLAELQSRVFCINNRKCFHCIMCTHVLS
jgi:hypothetical protein